MRLLYRCHHLWLRPSANYPTQNYLSWTFWNSQANMKTGKTFMMFLHRWCTIRGSTKLQYLKQCLTGTDADLVREVTIRNANYAPTSEALRDRFYKPWLIIVNHLRSLGNLPYLKQESAARLRSFADEAQRIVRVLKNLKLPTEHCRRASSSTTTEGTCVFDWCWY